MIRDLMRRVCDNDGNSNVKCGEVVSRKRRVA